jgi:nicotinamide mononucleotide transporter
MELLTALFSINTVVYTILDYPLTLVELFGTIFGLWSVILAARASIWNYPIGIINIIFFFATFYQVQLYADMTLQVYFLLISIYGWWMWANPRPTQMDAQQELKITRNTWQVNLGIGVAIVVGAGVLGLFFANVHQLLPALFPAPAAYPYADSLVMTMSIAAMYLLSIKKWENWLIWVAVDTCSIGLFYAKGIKLIALEYVVFWAIAAYGGYRWWQQMQKEEAK